MTGRVLLDWFRYVVQKAMPFNMMDAKSPHAQERWAGVEGGGGTIKAQVYFISVSHPQSVSLWGIQEIRAINFPLPRGLRTFQHFR